MERLWRTEAMLLDPMTMSEIVRCVASGSTLYEFTRQRDVRYNEVAAWIADDGERTKSYETAVSLRDTHNKDVVVETLRTMSTVDLADAIDEATNCYLPVHRMPWHVRQGIASIKVREQYANNGLVRIIAGKLVAELTEALKLDDDQIAKLKSFARVNVTEIKVGEVIEVRLWDRNKSTETLARSLQQLTDKVDVQGKITLEELVAGAQEAQPA